MNLWLGSQFALQATPVMQLLFIGAWLNGMAFIPYAFLQGQGRPDLAAKLQAFEVLPYILLLWFLVNRFGIAGAALAWGVRVAVDSTFLLILARFQMRHLLRLAPVIIIILATYAVTQLGHLTAIQSVGLAVLLVPLFFVIAIALDVNMKRLLNTLHNRMAQLLS